MPNGELVLELRREAPHSEDDIREIERRLPNGSLDPFFGKGGRVRVGIGAGLALRPDGALLVAVSRCKGRRASSILLDEQGNLIPSFGRDGCAASLPFDAAFITTQPDGRILLVGPREFCPCPKGAAALSETVVARLLADGSLDLSFGEDGIVGSRTDFKVQPGGPFGEESLRPAGVLSTDDGGAVIAAGALLLRLDASGGLVSSFGKGGIAEVAGRTAGLLSQPDGSIVVASTRSDPAYREVGELMVSRFYADGTLDQAFGSAGVTKLPVEGSARAVAVAPTGGVLVAGEIRAGDECPGYCPPIPFLTRLAADGKIVPNYGSDGIVTLPSPPDPMHLGSLGLSTLVSAPDGAALVAGGLYANDAFAFARRPDGTPNDGFADAGTLVERHYLPPNLDVSGFALEPDGTFIVAAEGTAGTHEWEGFLLGLRRSGRQERGPAGTHVVRTSARGEIQSIGGDRVVSWWGEGRNLLAARRHGAIARGYGDDGKVVLPSGFRARVLEDGPAGSVTMLGRVGKGAMGVYRIGPDGRPVSSFGDHGLAEVRFGRQSAIALAAWVDVDGSVVVTGWVGGRTGAARLLPSGRLDRSYGRGGRVRGLVGEGTYGSQLAPFHGGVVIAATDQKTPGSLAGLVRLARNGSVIDGFGRRGEVRPHTDGPPLALLAGAGRIVVVTDTENDPHSTGGVELRAYRHDGSVDRGFGRGGLARGGVDQVKYFAPVAAVQQRDGKICVAGNAWYGEYGQVELLRFR